MKLAQFLGGAMLIVWAVCVQAHAHLEEAVPADHSVTSTSPAALVLRFSEPARLTALWIARDGATKRKLPTPDESRARIVVSLPALDPGHYVVSWRALGGDGHVIPGQIDFTLTR